MHTRLKTLLHARLKTLLHARLEALLHAWLEAGRLLYLEGSKTWLLSLLWYESSLLGHDSVLWKLEILILLWESSHLLLNALHIEILQALPRWRRMGMHVRRSHIACQLGL